MKPMEYRGFIGTIECDVEGNFLHGKLFGIKDLVTYEAKTPASLFEEFKSAVDEYLADCKDLGRSPDRPCKGNFNVRIPPELHRELYLCSVSRGMSLNEYVHITLRGHDAGNVNVTVVNSHPYHWAGVFDGSSDSTPTRRAPRYDQGRETSAVMQVIRAELVH